MSRIELQTEDGLTLEGEMRLPEGAPEGSAVICHPHPRQGGSKDHPLLWAIRGDLAGRGFAVLSFNFRGVMGSKGTYGEGVAELMDVRAAIGRAREAAPAPTLVCGWSFGAHVALREALEDDRVSALVLIGLPLAESSLLLPPLPDRAKLSRLQGPVLLLVGEADPFCPLPDLRALERRLPRATVQIVKATDHFFWKREREAARIVGSFAQRELLGGGPVE